MATEKSEASHLPPAWPELPPQDVPTSWPEVSRQEPVPAWAEPPRPADPGPPPAAPARDSGWGNLSTPAPWPPRDNATQQPATWPPAQQEPVGWPQSPDASSAPQSGWPQQTGHDPLNQQNALNQQNPLTQQSPAGQQGQQGQSSQQGQGQQGQGQQGQGQQGQGQQGQWQGHPLDTSQPLQDTQVHPAWSPDTRPPAWNPEPQGRAAQEPPVAPAWAPQEGPATVAQWPDEVGPPVVPPKPPGDPMERTVNYAMLTPDQLAAAQDQLPPGQPGQPGQPGHPGQPGQPGQPGGDQFGQRPGGDLGRDPSDPDRPFVTAGQISGSRTPPPERQQELWNAVFSEGDDDGRDPLDDEERGKPVWMYALGASVAVALVIALVWAFVAGPLAGESDPVAAKPTPKSSAKPSASAKPANRFPRLPRYPGQASPVLGPLADTAAGLSVSRLGGRWLLDQRAVVQSTYGYTTRQYVQTGTDALGKPVFAQVLIGPLPAKLAAAYTSPDDLQPVIRQVVLNARNRFFAKPNTVRTTARQTLKNGAQINAYELTAGESKATVVVAAVPTGGEVPAIVYMQVPGDSKSLLPDVNTIMRSIKVTAGQ
ncbi:hypothetical protein [Nonomuraea sp. NPDC050310]|uniref:hypothetical protein n=1 Tax=Nonomuraea sp. NPDC050310 TaxID=3154935 RepID=UPI0033CC0B3A